MLAGVGGGLAAAAAMSSLIRRLLFGIEPNDLFTLAAAAMAVLVVAMVAAMLPAIQAARVDPARALRND